MNSIGSTDKLLEINRVICSFLYLHPLCARGRTSAIADKSSFIDQTESLKFLTKKMHCEQDVQNAAAEASLWTKRRLGELTAVMPKNIGGYGEHKSSSGCIVQPLLEVAPTYAELGLEKTFVHRCETLAAIPETIFREKLAELKQDGEVTTAGMLKSPHVSRNAGVEEWYTLPTSCHF